MSNRNAALCEEPDAASDRFEGLPDGAGCAEIWAYLSENGDLADGS